jgi:hypothetical protein
MRCILIATHDALTFEAVYTDTENGYEREPAAHDI